MPILTHSALQISIITHLPANPSRHPHLLSSLPPPKKFVECPPLALLSPFPSIASSYPSPMAKPWGVPGAWAEEAERAEQEEKERMAALEAAQAQSMKEKGQTGGGFAGHAAGNYVADPRAVSYISSFPGEDKAMLRTGPRGHFGELQNSGFGGGFREYPDRPDLDRREPWDRGSGRHRDSGVYSREMAQDMQHFRIDDRKAGPLREREFPFRRSDVAHWGPIRQAIPSLQPDRRFEDHRDVAPPVARASAVDNWGAAKRQMRRAAADEKVPDAGSNMPRGRQEPRPVAQSRVSSTESRPSRVGESGGRWPPVDAPVTSEPSRPNPRPNPFAAARPREVVLTERSLGEEVLPREKNSRPSTDHLGQHDRPSTDNAASQTAVKPTPKVNPFGDAKPREILLAERGLDWRKLDFELEHRAVEREDTEEEKILKDELRVLEEQLKKEKESRFKISANGNMSRTHEVPLVSSNTNIKELFIEKERQLQELTRTLDDQVRYAQRSSDRPLSRSGLREGEIGITERPGSHAGQNSGAAERPNSRAGLGKGARVIERPGSSHSDWGTGGAAMSERPGLHSSFRNGVGLFDSTGAGTGWRRTRSYEPERSFQSGRGGYDSERPGSGSGPGDMQTGLELRRPSSNHDEQLHSYGSNRSGRSADVWVRSHDVPRQEMHREYGWDRYGRYPQSPHLGSAGNDFKPGVYRTNK